jgi:Zn-finger nucleic acid-binding protein
LRKLFLVRRYLAEIADEQVRRAARTCSYTPAMECPRCGVALEERSSVHACASCGGVWLDPFQTETVFKRLRGDLALLEASDDAAQHSADHQPPDRAVVLCPACRGPLDLCEAEGVEIDRCEAHGTWFDVHELRRIAGAHASVRASAPRRATSPTTSRPGRNVDVVEWIEAFFGALIQAGRQGPPTH